MSSTWLICPSLLTSACPSLPHDHYRGGVTETERNLLQRPLRKTSYTFFYFLFRHLYNYYRCPVSRPLLSLDPDYFRLYIKHVYMLRVGSLTRTQTCKTRVFVRGPLPSLARDTGAGPVSGRTRRDTVRPVPSSHSDGWTVPRRSGLGSRQGSRRPNRAASSLEDITK